jgi:N-acetylglucosamine-6-phosphate deacetylase
VLTGRRHLDDAWVHVADGRIASVSRQSPMGGASPYRLSAGHLLAPGFVDIHVHGRAGVQATEGPDAIRSMARSLALSGVTAFLPTAATASLEALAEFAAGVASVRREQEARPESAALQARVLGANLEGPALDPRHCGAHDPELLTEPARVLHALRTAPDRWREVRIMTVAPELTGGLALVRHLAESGVVVSLGHSGATFDEAMAAYATGATSTTHLFNAMAGFAHRKPGLAAAALSHASAAVELIADGVHVDRALWPLIWRILGARLLAVSDGMSGGGAARGARRLGGRRVLVRHGRAELEDGTIAGSTITLADAVANLCEAGMPVAKAVATATTAPARLLLRRDIGRIGRGARADLVVLDRAGAVQRVMLGGAWLDA